MKLLCTFGSPLDKTTFLFRSRVPGEIGIREALSAAAQPLLCDPPYRTFPWINSWSPCDVISGQLDFYDWPELKENRVTNVVDPEANVPLLAHVQFWRNNLLSEILVDSLCKTQDTFPLPPSQAAAPGPKSQGARP